MALPKLETPTYELELPSTGEKIKYRPFLVKEQKVLMIAQGSNDEKVISNSIGTLVGNCTFDKIDPTKSPMFDIEYIFLKLRAKSIGETVELNITCPDDNKTTVPVKINLDEVSVQMTAGHTNVVDLTNDIKLYLRYPLFNDMQKLEGETQVDKVFNILLNCIHEVHHGDKIYNAVDVTKKDLETFIEQMTAE